MKNSTLLGSAVTVLLVFSVISYSRTYIQLQDPKPVQQPSQAPKPQSDAQINVTNELGPIAGGGKESTPANPTVPTDSGKATPASPSAPATYTATAYSLRGRTANGQQPARGIIAADPRVLPMGTRVRIDAGEFSGEYVVADTGGSVKGRRVDIWTPTAREALRFGKRAVKVTVLQLGGKKAGNKSATSSQVPNAPAPTPTATASPASVKK